MKRVKIWFAISGIILFFGILFSVVKPTIKVWNFVRFLKKMEKIHLPGAMFTVGARYENEKENFLEFQSSRRIHPGSNFKLFTAAASFAYLKPNFTFATRLFRWTSPDGKNHLLLVGSGDPSLHKDDVAEFASAAKTAGNIFDDLAFDDSVFEGERLGPSWGHDWKNQYFAVPITGLQINDNLLAIRKISGRIITDPIENYEPLADNIIYHKKEPKYELTPVAAEMNDAGEVTVKGETVATDDFSTSSTIQDPSSFTAKVFQQEFIKAGVLAKKARLIKSNLRDLEKKHNLTLLHEHRSKPLRKIIQQMLTMSKNNYAESLVRTLGRELRETGSQKKGVEVLEKFFTEAGIEGVSAFDGSGLAPATRASSNAILQLFAYIKQQSWAEEFWEALPESRVDGTLKLRFSEAGLKHPVIAKTGTHEFASSLSGKIVRDGKNILFSIHTFNHSYPTDEVAENIHPLIDRIVALLDQQF